MLASEVQEKLGLRIRTLRKAKGFSQEGFADACGLHRTYMSLVERGTTNISIQNLMKIAVGLKTDLGTLVAGVDRVETPPAAATPSSITNETTSQKPDRNRTGKNAAAVALIMQRVKQSEERYRSLKAVQQSEKEEFDLKRTAEQRQRRLEKDPVKV